MPLWKKVSHFIVLATLSAAVTGLFLSTRHAPPVVNVYCWYGMLSPEVLADFTKETGIQVRLDFFDTNDVVESKLLAGNSGYDIVFPTLVPYVSRLIQAGALQPLQKDKLPHLKEVDPWLIEKTNVSSLSADYSIPYYWGTLGFAYNEEAVLARMPDAPVHSYAMLFDPKIVGKCKDCGVTYLEEAVDVYPLVMRYLGLDPSMSDKENLKKTHEHLLKIRPFLHRFSSSRVVSELVSGEVCVAQMWSGDSHTAKRIAKELGRTIHYVIPEEGTLLWVDAMVVPKGAPNTEHAWLFMDYILRPEVAAKISIYAHVPTSIKNAFPYLPKSMQEDKTLFPSAEMIPKLYLAEEKSLAYEREQNRLWMNFRLNRRD